MPNYVTSAQYPDVRAAVDVSLTPTKLPDATIALAPFHPAAEAEVARRLAAPMAAANVTTLDADSTTRAQAAVILLTASRLVPAIPQVVQRQLGDARTQFSPRDLAKRVAELRTLAGRELAAITAKLDPTSDTESTPPTLFAVAPGGRAQQQLVVLGDGSIVEGL